MNTFLSCGVLCYQHQCVCEWRVLMASVFGFSSRIFPYKVFLLGFFLGGGGPPAP